ncbi:hypothetical protein OsI_38751 [Oryza sativa Indica Group]|uniref:Uncharacterized protein n=1 Tax=Oryza sativa subsp. indica TaxID=39946 RepID=A2ZLQ6_ORYSI|nr:hypothetical protein OsI_38751 [Oryza sativa Indica Group]
MAGSTAAAAALSLRGGAADDEAINHAFNRLESSPLHAQSAKCFSSAPPLPPAQAPRLSSVLCESLWCAAAPSPRHFTHSALMPAETDVEFEALAGAKKLDADVFTQLAPDIREDELPAPVLAVQVTELACGGVAVGLVLHHAATDGNGRIRFMQAWSAAVADAVENPEAILHN